jgi:hypothetical protein
VLKTVKAELGALSTTVWSIPMVGVEPEFADENARPIRLPSNWQANRPYDYDA